MSNRIRLRRTRASGAIGVTLALSLVTAGVLTPATGAVGQLFGNTEMPTLAPLIEEVGPAVVNISVSGSVAVRNPLAQDPFFRRFLPPDGRREFESAGSGVIVDAAEGYILTNHHVVENADKITITLIDNRSLEASVVGSDAGSDIAVLRVDPDGLTEMRLGDSERVRVGDFVLAIGNPFGLRHTVTSGIVSGLGRTGINPEGYEDFIQTDASINPGNSGGALVNLNGELVGINSAILSGTGSNIGIGFAIPINMARSVMEQIIAFGSIRRGLLGVGIAAVTPEIAEAYSLESASGALKAGRAIGDVIVSVNSEAVEDATSLRNAIGLLRPGDKVSVGFIREGKAQTIVATLDELDAPGSLQRLAEVDPVFDGAELVTNDARRTNFNGVAGLLVVQVEPGSPADMRGLRAGDVVTHINRQRITAVAEATDIVQSARTIILQVQRGVRSLLILMR